MPRPKIKTDLEIQAGIELPKDSKKGAEHQALTNKLATARLKRLNTQNSKLNIELRKLRGQVGDINAHRREVLAANSVVKQQVRALAFRLAPTLAATDDPREVQRILLEAIDECMNDLAYEREDKGAA